MKNENSSYNMRRLFIGLILIIVLFGCVKYYQKMGVGFLKEFFMPSTPREFFFHHALKASTYQKLELQHWDSIYQQVFQDTLKIDLPHQETMRLDSLPKHSAQAWRFTLKSGRRIHIQANKKEGGQLFGELFHVPNDSSSNLYQKKPLAVWEDSSYHIIYENKYTEREELIFAIQVAPDTTVSFDISFVSEPLLTFPVAGAKVRDIGSVWGDIRDGGRRRHEGNDIFASKGTPLIAVADGTVTSLRDSKLGGKTIWLRDREGRSLNYYYAHLDSQLVHLGQIVQRGDTIGTVGNTGNARYTPPHLHFGIYRRGAIDPFAFINSKDKSPRPSVLSIKSPGIIKKVPSKGQHFLRFTPQRKVPEIRQLKAEENVILLGTTKRYYRVRTEKGEMGYVNFD